jgi:hypothetical protein
MSDSCDISFIVAVILLSTAQNIIINASRDFVGYMLSVN